MQVVVEEDQAEDVAEQRAGDAADQVAMQVFYLRQRHEVLRYHEDGKADRLELQVAPLLEHHQGQHDYHRCLETSLPDPHEKVKNGQVLRILEGIVEPGIILCDLELS